MTTIDLRGPLLTVYNSGENARFGFDIEDYIDASKYGYIEDNRSNDCLADLNFNLEINVEFSNKMDGSDSASFD